MSKQKRPTPPALKAPNPEAVKLILEQAARAPLQNMDHAAAVDKAHLELRMFFQQLYADQIKDSGPPSNPAASANAAGS